MVGYGAGAREVASTVRISSLFRYKPIYEIVNQCPAVCTGEQIELQVLASDLWYSVFHKPKKPASVYVGEFIQMGHYYLWHLRSVLQSPWTVIS